MSAFGGRIAVVTGAGSGIGRALAVGLVQRGARVAASDVDADGLAETARLIGHGHRTDPLDVTDRAAVLAYADAVVAEFGHVNQVYNNAGYADGKALERFERVALRMAPADAARVILTGVARNRARVLVGADAKALDLLVRLTGSGYQQVMARLARRTFS